MNGDGYSDVIVGAFHYDNGEENEGAAFIYNGGPGGISGATPSWMGESNQKDSNYGYSVASGGDVNGDGFADVIIGAPGHSVNDKIVGQASVYLGGGGNGRDLLLQQINREDSTPIGRMGKADDNTYIPTGRMSSPFGRGKMCKEWENAPLGVPLDGSNSYIADWYDIGDVITIFGLNVIGEEHAVSHWRSRIHYHPVSFPYQPHGPWRSLPWKGREEGNLRFGPDKTYYLTDIVNYLLGKNIYPHDENTDGKVDAADAVHFLINN